MVVVWVLEVKVSIMFGLQRFFTNSMNSSYLNALKSPMWRLTSVCLCIQGFEGTLVWENLDSAGLSTVNASSVRLSDGGGVLKISSVRARTVSKAHLSGMFSQFLKCQHRWRSSRRCCLLCDCRSQRAYYLIEARLDFLVWLEGSRLLSTVGPAPELILSFLSKQFDQNRCMSWL